MIPESLHQFRVPSCQTTASRFTRHIDQSNLVARAAVTHRTRETALNNVARLVAVGRRPRRNPACYLCTFGHCWLSTRWPNSLHPFDQIPFDCFQDHPSDTHRLTMLSGVWCTSGFRPAVLSHIVERPPVSAPRMKISMPCPKLSLP